MKAPALFAITLLGWGIAAIVGFDTYSSTNAQAYAQADANAFTSRDNQYDDGFASGRSTSTGDAGSGGSSSASASASASASTSSSVSGSTLPPGSSTSYESGRPTMEDGVAQAAMKRTLEGYDVIQTRSQAVSSANDELESTYEDLEFAKKELEAKYEEAIKTLFQAYIAQKKVSEFQTKVLGVVYATESRMANIRNYVINLQTIIESVLNEAKRASEKTVISQEWAIRALSQIASVQEACTLAYKKSLHCKDTAAEAHQACKTATIFVVNANQALNKGASEAYMAHAEIGGLCAKTDAIVAKIESLQEISSNTMIKQRMQSATQTVQALKFHGLTSAQCRPSPAIAVGSPSAFVPETAESADDLADEANANSETSSTAGASGFASAGSSSSMDMSSSKNYEGSSSSMGMSSSKNSEGSSSSTGNTSAGASANSFASAGSNSGKSSATAAAQASAMSSSQPGYVKQF